jgi:hypothetical protein
MRQLKTMLRPSFRVLRALTIQPSGDRGFLRIVNSVKLNTMMTKVIPSPMLERWKEMLGLGQTLAVLARKRAG